MIPLTPTKPARLFGWTASRRCRNRSLLVTVLATNLLFAPPSSATNDCGLDDPVTLQGLPDRDADQISDAVDNCVEVANPEQIDSNSDGFGNVCDADLNGDLVTNVIDLGLLRQRFFTADADADLNGDGVVNVIDLGIMRLRFFTAPGPSGNAP